jgi:protein MAK11
MLSASEDGTICVWKCKTWECEKVLKAHRGAVTSISMHPSGKLALSVSKDKTIRTWNLLSGRCAYTTTLKNVADLVRWSPSGESYCVVSLKTVTIYQIAAV